MWDGNTWTLLQDWTADLNYTWTPASENDAYVIAVHIRDAGGTWFAWSQRSLPFPITGPLAGITVAFKLDLRFTLTYSGDVWVSPPTFVVTEPGTPVTVDIRATGFDARGTASNISPAWIPADPTLVTVSSGQGHQVALTVQRTGESSLQVVSQGVVKTLLVRATAYLDTAILLEISQ